MTNGTKTILWSVRRGIVCVQGGVRKPPKGGFHAGGIEVECGGSGNSVSKGTEAGNAGSIQDQHPGHRV